MMRRSVRAVLFLVVALTPGLLAQGTLSPTPQQQFLDANGNPVVNGKICTYIAGTTTPTATFTDSTLTIQNANPIRTDGSGRAVIYLTPGASYKYIVRTAGSDATCSTGTLVYTQDNIGTVPISSGSLDITAVAGENVVAGQLVYLSDGSGSKSAGQWYLADADLAYSSYTPSIGVATAAITSGNAGSVRVAGVVTNLTSLSVGSLYYASSTSGALTVTAPTPPAFRRLLGQADSATSLVLAANPPPPSYTQPTANDFRLTLTSGSCLTNTDVTAATTLYWTQCTGARVTLSDGFGNLETCATTERQIAIPATTSQIYDVWIYDSNFGTCTVTMELLAWTNDTTRATGIARVGTGFYTKSADLTRRYVGNVRTTTVSGQTEDSRTIRYIWNYYNRDRRDLQRLETNNSWNYSTATIRQANGSTSNQVDAIVGVAEATIDLWLLVEVKNNAASIVQVAAGIGESSTTTFAAGMSGTTNTANLTIPLIAHLSKKPAIGRTFYSWNEWSQATPTTTFVARDVSSSSLAGTLTGLTGWIEG